MSASATILNMHLFYKTKGYFKSQIIHNKGLISIVCVCYIWDIAQPQKYFF